MPKMKYIVGMGNYAMGDDAIGLHVIEYILEQGLDQGCTIIEAANDGMQLLNLFEEDTACIVVVDCAYMNKLPGEYILSSPEEMTTAKQVNPLTSHDGDVLQLIELGKQLQLAIPEIKIVAIEPVGTEMTAELSDLLKSRIPEYASMALEVIAR